MKTTIQNLELATFTLAVLTLAGLQSAVAQGSAFTYQGRLGDNGARASGDYDFRFTIYNAATNGNPVGNPLTTASVGVSDGLFTVALDFGALPFDGNPRWLEIGVRTNGSVSAYSLLAPRQLLTSTPYAVRAINA